MMPSIYEKRDNEIVVEREIKKRQRRDLIEAIICTPIMVALFIIIIFA